MDQSLADTVGKGTISLAISTWFLKGVGIVTILVVLNYLSVYEYGLAELVLSIVPLLSLFLLPGLNTTVIADMGIARSRGDLASAKGIFLNYFYVQFTLAAIVFSFVFLGAHAIAVFYGKEDISLLFRILSFAFLASPLRNALQVLQSVYFKFGQQSVYGFLEEAWKLVLVLFFFWVLGLGTEGLIMAAVFSQFLALISMSPTLFKIDRVFWATSSQRYPFFHLLKFHGKWGVFSSYLGTVGRNIRPWIIKIFLGTEAVGLFAVVQGLVGHTVSLIPLDRVMAPIIPRYIDAKERLYRVIAKAIKYQLLGYLLVSIALALLSPYGIAWFFPQYVPAVPLFQIMLIMLVSTAFDVIFSSVFYALQAQRNLFWASLYKLTLAVLLMPPFLYVFGLYGIAYANILVNFLYVWERYITLKRLMPGFSLDVKGLIRFDEDDLIVVEKIKELLSRWLRPALSIVSVRK